MDTNHPIYVIVFAFMVLFAMLFVHLLRAPLRKRLLELAERTGLVLEPYMLGDLRLTGVYRGHSVRVQYVSVRGGGLLFDLDVPTLSSDELHGRVKRYAARHQLRSTPDLLGRKKHVRALRTQIRLVNPNPSYPAEKLLGDLDQLCDLAEAILAEEPWEPTG
jgi:hypothetical protein